MDPVTISAGAGVLSSFLRTYEFFDAETEDERIENAVTDSVKKFVFFYEDNKWRELRSKGVKNTYQSDIRTEADGFREIAVKADGKLDEEIIENLREVSAELEKIAMKNLDIEVKGEFDPSKVSNGEILKRELEEPYQNCKDILEILD